MSSFLFPQTAEAHGKNTTEAAPSSSVHAQDAVRSAMRHWVSLEDRREREWASYQRLRRTGGGGGGGGALVPPSALPRRGQGEASSTSTAAANPLLESLPNAYLSATGSEIDYTYLYADVDGTNHNTVLRSMLALEEKERLRTAAPSQSSPAAAAEEGMMIAASSSSPLPEGRSTAVAAASATLQSAASASPSPSASPIVGIGMGGNSGPHRGAYGHASTGRHQTRVFFDLAARGATPAASAEKADGAKAADDPSLFTSVPPNDTNINNNYTTAAATASDGAVTMATAATASTSSSLPLRPLGRLVFELYEGACPIAVANFCALASGSAGFDASTGTRLDYAGTSLSAVRAGLELQMGMFNLVSLPASGGDGFDPSHSHSCTSASTPASTSALAVPRAVVAEERLNLRHTERGLLSLRSAGPHRIGSAFSITLGPAPELDFRQVIIGHLVDGADVLSSVEQLAVPPQRSGRDASPSSPSSSSSPYCGRAVGLSSPSEGTECEAADAAAALRPAVPISVVLCGVLAGPLQRPVGPERLEAYFGTAVGMRAVERALVASANPPPPSNATAAAAAAASLLAGGGGGSAAVAATASAAGARVDRGDSSGRGGGDFARRSPRKSRASGLSPKRRSSPRAADAVNAEDAKKSHAAVSVAVPEGERGPSPSPLSAASAGKDVALSAAAAAAQLFRQQQSVYTSISVRRPMPPSQLSAVPAAPAFGPITGGHF